MEFLRFAFVSRLSSLMPTTTWGKLLRHLASFKAFVVVLLGLFLCHELTLLHLFGDQTLFLGSDISQVTHGPQGFALPKELRSKLTVLEVVFSYRAKRLSKRHPIFRTGSNEGLTVYADGDGNLFLRTIDTKGYYKRVYSSGRMIPKRNYQIYVKIDQANNDIELSLFNNQGIAPGLLNKKILRHGKGGLALMFNTEPELRRVKVSAKRGEKIFTHWVKVTHQNGLQRFLEYVYYALWAVFWAYLGWRFLRRALRFFTQVSWHHIDLLSYKAVFLFFLGLLSYLLLSIFALYILPPHWFEYLRGFLFLDADRFGDLFAVVAWGASKNPYLNEFGWDGPVYYPVMMLLVKPLVYFEPNTLKWGIVLFGFWLAWFGANALAADKQHSDSRNISLWLFFITLCTYPFIFAFDRANLDLLMLLFILLYIRALKEDRWLQAGFWIGIAIAAKAYPGLFILLALRKRDWKTPLAAGVVVVVSSIAAMEIFGGEYARSWMWFQAYFRNFQNHYVIGYNYIYGFNYFSDFYSFLKIFTVEELVPFTTADLFKYYSKVALIFIALISYVVVFKKDEPEYLQLAMIGTGVIIFPGMAYDYRLVCLLPALYAYFHRAEPHPRDKVFWVYLFAILTPKHFGLIAGKWFLSCFVNPLINLALLAYGGLPHATWARLCNRCGMKLKQILPPRQEA